MEESDSENENDDRPAGGDDDEKYPVDGMFTSIQEKHRIMALREVERESILAERTTEIERQRQNRMLRQLVSKQENEEKKAMKIRKRTASSADLEDDDRKSSRQRTETKTSSGIDTLRRARAEKNDRARAREENRRTDRHSPNRGRRGSSVASSRVSYNDKDRSPSPKVSRELPPPTLRDFERIRVGKSRFAQYCFNPGFEDALTGCYVRVSLGPDPSGVDQYRMARIKGMLSAVYHLDPADHSSFHYGQGVCYPRSWR
jgi:RNA polymerase-associated protein RTF1